MKDILNDVILAFDKDAAVEKITNALRVFARKARKRGVVVAISGGIDSSVTSALCVRAFGKVSQQQLDNLKSGIEIEGIKYGPIEATLEREQGAGRGAGRGGHGAPDEEVERPLCHLRWVHDHSLEPSDHRPRRDRRPGGRRRRRPRA